MGSALIGIGEQNSDSMLGQGVHFMGKMYTSWGNNLVDVGQGEKSAGEATQDIIKDVLTDVENTGILSD